MCTLLPYFVRKVPSSMALSPPPMTTNGCLLDIIHHTSKLHSWNVAAYTATWTSFVGPEAVSTTRQVAVYRRCIRRPRKALGILGTLGTARSKARGTPSTRSTEKFQRVGVASTGLSSSRITCRCKGLYLNIGAAPSQTAHAEMPLFQNPSDSSEPLNLSLFATAPVSGLRLLAFLDVLVYDSLKVQQKPFIMRADEDTGQ